MPEREHRTSIITPKIETLHEYSAEAHAEQKTRASDISMAEGARALEDKRKTWWGVGLSLALSQIFGPIGVPLGVGLGKIIGGAGTVGGEDVEDYLVSTDVGKYERGERLNLEKLNEDFKKYDKGELLTDALDVGKSLLFAWSAGGGSLTEKGGIENFDPFKWGGKKGKTSSQMWGDFFDRPEVKPSVDISSLKSPEDYQRFWMNQDIPGIYKEA